MIETMRDAIVSNTCMLMSSIRMHVIVSKTIKALRSASPGDILCSHTTHVDIAASLFKLLPPFPRNAAFLVLIAVHMDSICMGLP